MAETWGSTAHGAGRTMSRAQAKRRVWSETLIKDMQARGIVVRAASKSGVAEEAGFAYKDLAAVVDTLHRLDISRRHRDESRGAQDRGLGVISSRRDQCRQNNHRPQARGSDRAPVWFASPYWSSPDSSS